MERSSKTPTKIGSEMDPSLEKAEAKPKPAPRDIVGNACGDTTYIIGHVPPKKREKPQKRIAKKMGSTAGPTKNAMRADMMSAPPMLATTTAQEENEKETKIMASKNAQTLNTFATSNVVYLRFTCEDDVMMVLYTVLK
uniref:Uncharacterized protein n=1 Tax=Octactis speculum TaxID=3111310 RepID=A0A7S2BVD6_9STRA|mmetsp:Transcript_27596/g.37834  ORF Transcript_27596/g.37834 Transcript_27596/m.37834 type:complete len:139 (+) Transcript_27596:349-765(+)